VLSLVFMSTALNYRGLALANSLAALTEAALLLALLGRRLNGLDLHGVLTSLSRTVVASLVMGLTIATLPRVMVNAFSLPASFELVVVIGVVALAGVAVYLVLAYLLRSEELRVLLRLARSRS
jgi:putative peptidoglycan lipid II flippase